MAGQTIPGTRGAGGRWWLYLLVGCDLVDVQKRNKAWVVLGEAASEITAGLLICSGPRG